MVSTNTTPNFQGLDCTKITDVRTVALSGAFANDKYMLEMTNLHSVAYIEVNTDFGLGEIVETYGTFFPEGVPPILNGSDIAGLWQRMYHCGNFWCHVGLGLILLHGIETAIWDLRGKHLGKPVYELLGAKIHYKVLCYDNGV